MSYFDDETAAPPIGVGGDTDSDGYIAPRLYWKASVNEPDTESGFEDNAGSSVTAKPVARRTETSSDGGRNREIIAVDGQDQRYIDVTDAQIAEMEPLGSKKVKYEDKQYTLSAYAKITKIKVTGDVKRVK
ncbi:unnamed protein product [Oikopleura dioica]|uniref:Uncharacterized protein n=1 Tax=Oikopleura dioica TaxID=34765 RepID=E4YPU5_OIKDI|nr:unnamed protein product [Oikopleura dioica]